MESLPYQLSLLAVAVVVVPMVVPVAVVVKCALI
jgi:hypothetical protein